MNRFTATLAATAIAAMLILPSGASAYDGQLHSLGVAHLNETKKLIRCTTRGCTLTSLTKGYNLVTRIEKRASVRMQSGDVGQECVEPARKFIAAVRKSLRVGTLLVRSTSPARVEAAQWATIAVDQTLPKLAENC